MKPTSNLHILSNQIYLAEDQSDPTALTLKMVLCDFSVNKNDAMLDEDTAEDCLPSAINQPLVGKIEKRLINGQLVEDFTGHNMTIEEREDEDGNTYSVAVFDTSAFGTITDANIEEINDLKCITITGKVWKRFESASKAILRRVQNGTLHSSYELATEEATPVLKDGKVVRKISKWRLIGNAFLGAHKNPAYSSAGVLEVAEELDDDFTDSLIADLMATSSDNTNTTRKEDDNLSKQVEPKIDEPIVAEGEPVVDPTPVVDDTQTGDEPATATIEDNANDGEGDNEPDVAELTADDIYNKICNQLSSGYPSYIFPESKTVLARSWNMDSLEYDKYTYTIDGDNIVLSQPERIKLMVSVAEINEKIAGLEASIATRDETILSSASEIKGLRTEIAELAPFKDKFETAEAERIKAEQDAKKEALVAEVSDHISREDIETSEELKGYVENLDRKSLLAYVAELVIAEKKKTTGDTTIEVAEDGTKDVVKANLNVTEPKVDKSKIMDSWFGR